MASLVPAKFFWLARGREERRGLLGPHRLVEAAVHHQQGPAVEGSDGADWIGNRARKHRERRLCRQVAAGGQCHGANKPVCLGDRRREERP